MGRFCPVVGGDSQWRGRNDSFCPPWGKNGRFAPPYRRPAQMTPSKMAADPMAAVGDMRSPRKIMAVMRVKTGFR